MRFLEITELYVTLLNLMSISGGGRERDVHSEHRDGGRGGGTWWEHSLCHSKEGKRLWRDQVWFIHFVRILLDIFMHVNSPYFSLLCFNTSLSGILLSQYYKRSKHILLKMIREYQYCLTTTWWEFFSFITHSSYCYSHLSPQENRPSRCVDMLSYKGRSGLV